MTTEAKIVLTAQDKTARAFSSVRQSLRGMESAAFTARRALGAIGVGISAGALVTGLTRAASAAIKYGDEIAKANAKTGVGAEAFSQLAYAARQNDVSLTALGTSFRKLQVTISEAGSGSKTALASFKALGIEFESFRRLSPDRQFEQIAEQISRLKDPADRARAAVELFGRAGAELLPLFEEGASGIRKLREEAIRTGRSLSEDQIKKLAEADLAVKNLTAEWESFARTMTAKVAPSLSTVLSAISDPRWITFRQLAESTKRAFEKNGFFTSPLDLIGQIGEDERATAPLGSARRTQALSRGGGISPTPPGFQPEADKAAKEKSPFSEIQVWQREMFDFATMQQEAFDSYSREFNESFSQSLRATTNETTKMLGSMTVEVEKTFDAWSVYADQGARDLQSAFATFLFDPFENGLRGMAQGFVDTIRQMLAQYLAFQAFTGLGGALSGSTNPFLKSIGGFLSGARASGGPVAAGGAYLVGERGPELFMPRSSGSIIPNGAMAGVTVNYSIDARGADADRIMAIMPGLMRQSEQRTIARVQELIGRGRLA